MQLFSSYPGILATLLTPSACHFDPAVQHSSLS